MSVTDADIKREMAEIKRRMKRESYDLLWECARMRAEGEALARFIIDLDIGLPNAGPQFPHGMSVWEAAMVGLGRYKALRELFDFRVAQSGS